MTQKIREDMTNQYKVVRDKPRIKNEKKLKAFLQKYAQQINDSNKGGGSKS